MICQKCKDTETTYFGLELVVSLWVLFAVKNPQHFYPEQVNKHVNLNVRSGAITVRKELIPVLSKTL